jgi:tetratricopeptide (TPR) repeat protein
MPDISAVTQPSRHMENPTPKFVEKCRNALDRWEEGAMSIRETILILNQCSQEAMITHHLANQGYVEHILGYIEHTRGNLESSIQHYKQARALFVHINNQRFRARMELNLGENYRFQGDFDQALELYQNVYMITEQVGDLRIQTFSVVNKGTALFELGENNNAYQAFEEGLALIEQWQQHFEQKNKILGETHYGMALIHMRRDDPDAAWEHLHKCLQAAEARNQPWTRGYAHRLAGILVSEIDPLPDSTLSPNPDDHFQQAMDAFKEINAEAELARTIYAQARSLGQREERLQAARKFQQAMLIFNRLGMINDAALAAEAQLNLI